MAGTSRHRHFRCSCIPASMNPMTITMSTYRPSDGAANVHDRFDEKNTYYLNESRCTWKNIFGLWSQRNCWLCDGGRFSILPMVSKIVSFCVGEIRAVTSHYLLYF
jgi:hypothetical protein